MENFDMNRFFKVFLNSKFYIIFILLLCLAIGYFYSYHYVTPMYQSSATVVLVQNEDLNQENDTSITQKDLTLNKNLLATYTKIAKSNRVLEQVIENLNLSISSESLASLVTVQAVNNTEVFKITVRNKDNTLAASITNELLEVFSNEVNTLYHMNNVYTMDQAEISNTPNNMNHKKDLIMFFMMGMAISFGLVVVIYLLDNTIKCEKDIEEYTGLSVLSSIPMYTDKKQAKKSELIVNEQPKSPVSECFKTFRTNVMFSIQNKKLNTILVTSGDMNEGKSFVSSNLAVTFAQSGKKVILVDTDMRKGRIHKIFDLPNRSGLSNCLSNIGMDGINVNINQYIQESTIPNLHIMTSGNVPPNPSELLSSSNMIQFLEALNRQYDVVICDGTPCMLVSDSIILSKIVDTTVIVTASKSTKLDTLLKIKKSIEIVGGSIGGTVINKMPVSTKAYQNQYYYGNHEEIENSTIQTVLVHDITLDTPLYVKELKDIIIEPESKVENNMDALDTTNESDKKELHALSTTIQSNTEEMTELKELYKNVMHNTLNVIANTQDHVEPILEQLKEVKQDYNDTLLAQNKQISSLEDKILNIEMPDHSDVLLQQLNQMKQDYNNNLLIQNEQISSLKDEILSIEIPDHSDILIQQLNQMKQHYNDNILAQNEQISSLEDKILNIKIPDHSDVILNTLTDIKENYEISLLNQNSNIEKLQYQIDNLSNLDYSEEVLDKLENIKNMYEENLMLQSNQIGSLKEQLNYLEHAHTSDEIIQELGEFRNEYNSDLLAQTNKLDSLENKLENFTPYVDHTDELLEKMEEIKTSYNNALSNQDIKINELASKLTIKESKEDSELLIEVMKIYSQLETMNARFESLEKRSANNEILMKNLSKEARESFYHPTKTLDITKLNRKVVQIQDYLESKDEEIIVSTKNKNRKSKNILDGQMNIIDDLLDKASAETVETVSQNLQQPNLVVDYEKVKRKQERKGFNFFKSRVEEIEEQPICIVSQILNKNSENVS